jgi:DNA-binding beta-propeller fold protein YncE
MNLLSFFLLAASLLFSIPTGGGPAPLNDRGTLVVVNQAEHTVLFVEPALRRKFASISVGVNGHEAAVSPDARFVYVPIYGNSGVGKPGTDGATIDVIDIAERRLAPSIELGKPLRPHRAEFGPAGLLYVTAELGNEVLVVDPSARKVLGEIPTGEPQSHMLVISPDGRRAYTANVGAGNISVLDIPGRRLLSVIPVAKIVQRISISPDGHRLFTHDQDAPRLAVIDISASHAANTGGAAPIYKVTQWIDLPGTAYASEPTPDGKWLLVACPQNHLLLAIDLVTMKVVKSFDMPGTPSEILVRPDGGVAFVSCTDSGKIAVVDLKAWQLQEPITLTRGVDGLAWIPVDTNR